MEYRGRAYGVTFEPHQERGRRAKRFWPQKGWVIVELAPVTTRDISHTPKKFPFVRVLVVDDEPLLRWSLSETLSDCGYQVVATGDARGARNAVREAPDRFDVVLLDFRLPDTEDLALLVSIRRLSPHAQVILMTAFGTPEVVSCALDLGAYRVISKPFEMQEIAELVAQAHAARIAH